MKRTFILLFLILASCTSPQTVAQDPEGIVVSSPKPAPTLTHTSVPVTVTIPPTIPPTETPILCDPSAVDYCITDGYFVLQRPIQPPYNDSVDGTYRYASTANGTRDPHHGIEIGKNYGTPIQAAADGVVLFAGPDEKVKFSPWSNLYGNMIVIQHAADLYTLYAHLSKIEVQTDQVVKVGEKIGEVGQTGAATGSHLHFEVRRGNVEEYFSTLNPELWLQPKPGCGALMISLVNEKGTFQRGSLTIQAYTDASEPVLVYYLDTYHPTLALGDENVGMGDLPAGRYRITLLYNGHLSERWVAVQSGRLTQVVLVVQ